MLGLASGDYDLDSDIWKFPQTPLEGNDYACQDDLRSIENRINAFFEEEEVHAVRLHDYLKELGQF